MTLEQHQLEHIFALKKDLTGIIQVQVAIADSIQCACEGSGVGMVVCYKWLSQLYAISIL